MKLTIGVSFTAGVNTDGEAPVQSGLNPAAADDIPLYCIHHRITGITVVGE